MKRAIVTHGGGLWTASYLGFIADLAPDQVLSFDRRGYTLESREEYRWISFARRLVWAHGVAGALQRLNGEGV